MSCSRYRQLISRYVDNEVTPRQRADLMAHVQVCHDCAAWLARARHTDVLLKGVGATHPSDRVRNAILREVRAHGAKPSDVTKPTTPTAQPVHRFDWLRLGASSLLLRFDPSPARIAVGLLASFVALLGLAYSLNLLPPVWGYNKLGFEYPQGSGQAVVDTTPIPMSAVSSGQGGVGGPVAVPNLVRILPPESAQSVPLDNPVRVRFDQPMDRGSVEGALRIDPPAAGIFSWDADNEVRFTPASPGLLRGITYTVTLTGTALSMAGTPVKNAVNWAFRTQNAYSVSPGLRDGAPVLPAATFSLQFSAPMQKTGIQDVVLLRQVGSNLSLSYTYSWDVSGQTLSIQPANALPEGYLYLMVRSDARTASDESLGQAYEFKYHVETTAPVLRLQGDRVMLARQGSPLTLDYRIEGNGALSFDTLSFDVYALPAEWLSALGAQARKDSLPVGFTGGLQSVLQLQPASLEAVSALDVDGLQSGIYLILANGTVPTGSISDWKMLVVGDRSLALTGSNSPLWATDQAGRPWTGAEVSLYSPQGALLEKGLTDAFGLWLPSVAANGASLAIARDLDGHVAASLIGADQDWGATADSGLPASLVTDAPTYRPGDTVNFRLMLRDVANDVAPSTPVAERSVTMLLITPGGATVAALDLKPDEVGGITGQFALSPNAQPGVYMIRARSGGLKRDFPVTVAPSNTDALSVYIVPSAELEVGDTTITRTVSVLGLAGAPAAGALVTATLGIRGDSWVSRPIVGTADANGRATLIVPLPAWFSRFNEPALYMDVAAQAGDLLGSDRSYIDLTSQHSALSGMTQLVSPGMNVAVIARPIADGPIKVRVVLLDQLAPAGDIFVQAVSPTGERASYSLDMARLLDATLDLPQRFAGGIIRVQTSGVEESRTLALMPAKGIDADLRVIVPLSVTAGADLPLRLGMTSLDHVGMSGMASVWLRRVSGDPSQDASVWQPSLALMENGTIATTVQAPTTPGLWYVMAESASSDGIGAVSWGVVRVLAGPSVQLPPMGATRGGEARDFSVTLHNPTEDALSSGLRTASSGVAHIVGAESQAIDVPANGWRRVQWRAVLDKQGLGRIAFSFMPGSGTAGTWPLDIASEANPGLDVTYTSGMLTTERNVGVAVPSGLQGDHIQLEIRASTSLLAALAGAAIDLQNATSEATEGVSLAAARLSAPASVASAYERLNAAPPDSLQLSSVERSLLLQQIYSAQREDGGWSYTLRGDGTSSLRKTAEVLLAMHRWSSYAATGSVAIAPDGSVLNHAVEYLLDELMRPLHTEPTQSALDERAFGLYVLSLYKPVPADWVRPLLAYAASGLGEHGLSRDGQAWLALTLWQGGNSADAAALLDRLLLTEPASFIAPSASMLEALVVGLQSLPAGGVRSSELPDYAASARLYATALMEARQGAGWHTPTLTADALWALSRYAAATGDKPQSGATPPALTLSDRPLEANVIQGNPGTVSVILSGAELKPGTNWLKIKTSTSNQTLYYSLTLIAMR